MRKTYEGPTARALREQIEARGEKVPDPMARLAVELAAGRDLRSSAARFAAERNRIDDDNCSDESMAALAMAEDALFAAARALVAAERR